MHFPRLFHVLALTALELAEAQVNPYPQVACTWTYSPTVTVQPMVLTKTITTITSDSSVDCHLCDMVTAMTSTVLDIADAMPTNIGFGAIPVIKTTTAATATITNYVCAPESEEDENEVEEDIDAPFDIAEEGVEDGG